MTYKAMTEWKESTRRKENANERVERFNKLMMRRNIKAAVRLLSANERGGVLPLNEETMNELKKKHPDSQPQIQHLLLCGPALEVNPVIFDKLDETTILQAALRKKGAIGPSMSNADDWRRIFVSHHYGNTTVNLRKSVAVMAKSCVLIHKCTDKNEDPDSIESLVACRLILLSKDPGVRPIEIGEVLRRIIGKAVTNIIKEDIVMGAGNFQLYFGQKSSAELAIRAATELFENDDSHGILQIHSIPSTGK